MLDQIKEAREAGYSDADILAHIKSTHADLAPNIEEALSGGYGDTDVVDYIGSSYNVGTSQQKPTKSTSIYDNPYLDNPVYGLAEAVTSLGSDLVTMVPKGYALYGAWAGGASDEELERIAHEEYNIPLDLSPKTRSGKQIQNGLAYLFSIPGKIADHIITQNIENPYDPAAQELLSQTIPEASLELEKSPEIAAFFKGIIELLMFEGAAKGLGALKAKKAGSPVEYNAKGEPTVPGDWQAAQAMVERQNVVDPSIGPGEGLKAMDHRAKQMQGTIGEKIKASEQRVADLEAMKAEAAESALFERAADKPVPGPTKALPIIEEGPGGAKIMKRRGDTPPGKVGVIDDAVRRHIENEAIEAQPPSPAHPGATTVPRPEPTGMVGRAPKSMTTDVNITPEVAEPALGQIGELQAKFLEQRKAVGADTSRDMGKLGRRDYGGRLPERPEIIEPTETPIEVVEPTGIQDNASMPGAEGAGSLEAIGREASEKASGRVRHRLNTKTGEATPLIGVDAVDAVPNIHEVIVQEGVGKDAGAVILDRHPSVPQDWAGALDTSKKAAEPQPTKAAATHVIDDAGAIDLSSFSMDVLQKKFLDLMERGEEKGHPLYDAIHDEITARAAKEIELAEKAGAKKEKSAKTTASAAKTVEKKAAAGKPKRSQAKKEAVSAPIDKSTIPVTLAELKATADKMAKKAKKSEPVSPKKPVSPKGEKAEPVKVLTTQKALKERLTELGQEEFNHQYNPLNLEARLIKELTDKGVDRKLAKTRVRPKIEKYSKIYDKVNNKALEARTALKREIEAKGKKKETLGDVEYETVNVEVDAESQAILEEMGRKGIERKTNEPRSEGHDMFVGHWEYFTLPNGKLYRAPRNNPITKGGFRSGSKWVASGGDVAGALEIAKGLARKRGTTVTLDSMGLQSGYEMVKDAITDLAATKEKYTSAKASKVKKTLTLRAKNIWGKGHAKELKRFARQILDTKKPIDKLSLRQLKKLETGLDYLKNEIGANPGGDPTVIARKGRADYTNVTEPQSNIMRSAYELTDRMELTKSSKTGTGMLETPIRVFEEIGKGVKELFYDKIVEADKVATRKYKAMVKEFEPVIKGIKKAGEKKVTAYAISKQKGGVKALKDMGVEAPKWDSLTGPEQAAYNFMRKKYEMFYKNVNAARVKAGLKPFKKVDNYFTFWNQYQSLLDRGTPMHSVSFDGLRGETPFRFKKQRKGGNRLWLEGFEIFKNYAEQAFQHEMKTPEIAHMNELLGKYEDGFSVGKYKPNTHKFLTDWVNTAAGKPIETAYPGLQKAGRMINENLAAAVLAYNIRSAIIQPTAIVATNSLIGPKYTMRGVQALFSEPVRQFVMDNSVVINREYDVHVRDLMKTTTKVKKKAAEIGLKPLQWLDKQTAVATWYGAYEMGKDVRGLTEAEAIRFADDTVTKTQASAKEYDLAPIQRNVAGKTVTLFQTFVINHFDMLRKDVLGYKNQLVTRDQAAGRLGRWLVGVTITNMLFENILGINSPFPSPINQFKDQMDAGKTAPEAALHAAKEFVDVVPMLSSLRYGSSPGGPVIELATDISEAFSDKPGPTRSKLELAGKALGVPGTAQVSKTKKRLGWGSSLPAALIGAGKKGKKSKIFTGGRGRSGRSSRSR